MKAARFDYVRPGDVADALAVLGQAEGAKLLAGGQSLGPMLNLRLVRPALLVDVSRLEALQHLEDTGSAWRIGAGVTHARLEDARGRLAGGEMLCEVASAIAYRSVRNRGTIGGSLAQAHPSADYPAAVLALDARIVTASQSGERVIPAREFFTGMFTSALRPDEIITEIRVPKTTGAGTVYKKFAHPASGYAVVGVAVVVRGSNAKIDEVAVGITGVGEIAYRATAVEAALRGKAASALAEAARHAADKVEALGDNYASAEYRRHLAQVYTRRALQEALAAKRK